MKPNRRSKFASAAHLVNELHKRYVSDMILINDFNLRVGMIYISVVEMCFGQLDPNYEETK